MGLCYWLINYCEELLKLYMFLFGIIAIERKNKKAIACIFIAGLIVVFLFFLVDNKNTILLKVVVGLLIITENILFMEQKTFFYMAILSEILIIFVDMIFGVIVFDLIQLDAVWENTDNFINISINSFSLLILSIYSFIIYKKNIKYDLSFLSKGVVKTIVFVIGSLVVFCIYAVSLLESDLLNIKTKFNGGHYIIDIVIISLFVIISIKFLINVINRERFQSENGVYRTLIKHQKFYYEGLLKREEQTRKFRHDIMGHLNYIKICLDDGEEEKAILYLKQVYGTVSRLQKDIETGNNIINIVIGYALLDADDIEFDWKGIFPDDINMEEIDLCILFNNLLSNAIRSSKKSQREKSVKVECRILGRNIFIQIRNSVNEDEKIRFVNGRPISSRDKQYHGLGIINIESVIKKYNGNLCFQYMDDFIVNIILENIVK